MVHASVTSMLDIGDTFLDGLPGTQLQTIQKHAERVVIKNARAHLTCGF